MTLTTIRGTAELRDALKQQASAHRRTLGEQLQHLIEEEARRERFRSLRAAMDRTGVDEAYQQENRDWQSESWS